MLKVSIFVRNNILLHHMWLWISRIGNSLRKSCPPRQLWTAKCISFCGQKRSKWSALLELCLHRVHVWFSFVILSVNSCTLKFCRSLVGCLWVHKPKCVETWAKCRLLFPVHEHLMHIHDCCAVCTHEYHYYSWCFHCVVYTKTLLCACNYSTNMAGPRICVIY